tara:strand:- start:338 stop:793 length:456 start_codon:yes stop_codon:yes gene_type:complete
MSDEIKIQEQVMSTPYDDNEHPNIRFDIKENEDVTKHILFYKTDKKNSFSKGRKPSDILFDMFREIQKLPKIKNKDDENDIETFEKFINFINIFIPHLIINSNSEKNVIDVNDSKKNTTIDELHDAFKLASKRKRKAMLDKFGKESLKKIY